jgi:hypothetical protein
MANWSAIGVRTGAWFGAFVVVTSTATAVGGSTVPVVAFVALTMKLAKPL